MQLQNTNQRYGLVSQALHWTLAVLVSAQLVIGTIGADMPLGIDRLVLLARHKSIGLTIFMLALVRLLWRAINPVPSLPDQLPQLERTLARLTHWLFYAFLLSVPVIGWLHSSASNLSVSWFGIVVLPDLVEPDTQLASVLGRAHQILAWMMAALVCLHVLAALRHHFMLGDDILRRMLPRVGSLLKNRDMR